MPLKGNGFMIVWHDIKAEGEADYYLWHTREHMPERLGVPGFLRGRRGVDWSLGKYRYLTLYEGETLETFGTPEYLQRLNNPTPWTLRNQPNFFNFIRSACDIAASVGRGVGGAMVTIRVPFGDAGEAGFRATAGALADELLALEGANAVHVGTARPDITGAKTKETELRGMTKDNVFDGVVMVDGVGRRELEKTLPEILRILGARGLTVGAEDAAVYDMAYCLEPTG
jgi:hypothetical protein